MKWIQGGVTAAAGFRASGISAGIKRSRKPDLALIVAADDPATAVGVFTTNRVKAAPVVISRKRLRHGRAQAVLINSGCANCLTGSQGLRDALILSRAVAHTLGIDDEQVLVASTGIIGRRLPVSRMQRVIPLLADRLSRARHAEAAQAILTTDRRVKEAAVEARIDGRVCRLGGMAKGAGMIAPSMATMLCVVTTDVAIAPAWLRTLLRQAVARTFNRISIDGDMSTNDTVFALAGGRSGVTIRQGTAVSRMFSAMLTAVCERLARLIVQDGEGVTKLAEIRVAGARNAREAQACAQGVAGSLLVKTMLAGGDPNVGRIAAAIGASPAVFDPARLEIFIGPHRVVRRGAAVRLGKMLARQLLAHPETTVRIQLHAGRAEGRMLSCDLTEHYVRINASYPT
ncbi:MAG: bifunctional glutamate N-acetyltransferase/amino-acid acetyltransferase ArgJ [Candidatus Omnitrophica bacterium]|nr:bifunctional glutamate N-acetyltransferase/amino-acid acetyltransferase ArgJ [Candidatus Omnitrophota bacterium]